MSYIQMTQNASYNFKAPNIEADADKKIEVVFPTSENQSVEAAATIAVDVNRTTTLVDLGTLAADATLNLTIGDDVPVGAILNVKAKSDTTARAITLGTGFTGPAISGVISKTKSASYIFDGTTFLAMGTAVQLD